MTAPVEASGLGYRYPDGTRALDAVSLDVGAGERVALLGPNGAGKSTLLELLGGLREPDAGVVRYWGADRDADGLRDRVAVVTQDPADYLFNPTVREDLAYGPAQLGLPRETARERVERIADRLGLTDLLDRPPFRLSGGEKRRAALASALTVEPDLLFVDEPLGAVDAANRRTIRSLLAELNEAGVTVVVATPDADAVPELADRVVLLDADGDVARIDDVRAVVTDVDLLRECGLAPPRLVDAFDRAGVAEPPLSVPAAARRLRSLADDDRS